MRCNKPEIFNNSNLLNVIKITEELPIESRYISIGSDKEKTKLIKKIEMVVRSSPEYREYIKYLKEYVDLTACHFFNQVKNNGRRKISIEIHHEPFTLFDITNIVLTRWIENGMTLNTFLIAEEVMKLHFQNKVGLIPLSITVHELVHDGKIFIPLQDVYGKGFIQFVQDYDVYIDPDLRRILNEKIEFSRDIAYKQDLSILEKKYVYIDYDGFVFPQLQDLE